MRRVTGRIILKHFALWTADRRQRTTVQSKCSHRPRQRKPSRLRRGGRRRRARRRWHVRGPAGSLLGARSGREHVAVCQRKLLEPHHGLRTCSARRLRPPESTRSHPGSIRSLRFQHCAPSAKTSWILCIHDGWDQGAAFPAQNGFCIRPVATDDAAAPGAVHAVPLRASRPGRPLTRVGRMRKSLREIHEVAALGAQCWKRSARILPGCDRVLSGGRRRLAEQVLSP